MLDPAQTREVLHEGWLATRDVGRLHPSGLLQLTGRRRDVIMVNAEVCYAGAIEQVLARDPHVERAFVVGVPDPRTGEAVHAFVVTTNHREPDRDALADLVRTSLTPAHIPTTITPLPEVPVTAAGKPDKGALAALIPPRPG